MAVEGGGGTVPSPSYVPLTCIHVSMHTQLSKCSIWRLEDVYLAQISSRSQTKKKTCLIKPCWDVSPLRGGNRQWEGSYFFV